MNSLKKSIRNSVIASSCVMMLSSGLASAFEVDFEKNDKLPHVTLSVAFKNGSVNDPASKSGLTAFLSEMLLRGTQHKTKQQLDKELDQLGARLEVETRAESTILRGAVLSSKLDQFLKILAEIITEPSFPQTEINKLRSEMISNIQEELGQDGALGSRAFTRFLLRGHPYGNPVYGTTKGLSKITREDLVSHYQRIVRDENLLVVGTGDASQGQMEKWASQLSRKLPEEILSEEDKLLISPVSAPDQNQRFRVQIVDKPDRVQTQISGGQIGITMTHPDFIALHVANHAFGGHSFSAVLMTEIRTKRGWSYGANSGFRHGLQPRSWYFHLFPTAKDTPNALALTVQLVRDLKEKGLDQATFDFAKESLINNSGFMYNTARKRAENILLERTLHLPEGFMKTFQSKIEKISLADTNRAIQKFLRPEQMAISVVGTASQIKQPIAHALGIDEKSIEVEKYTLED